MHYPDRVCFGSDAFLCSLERVLEYIGPVRELAPPSGVEEQVFSGNPKCFLGAALD